MPGDDQNGGGADLPKLGEEVQAVFFTQRDIEDQKIRGQLPEASPRLVRIPCGMDGVRACQGLGNHLEYRGIVVNGQDDPPPRQGSIRLYPFLAHYLPLSGGRVVLGIRKRPYPVS